MKMTDSRERMMFLKSGARLKLEVSSRTCRAEPGTPTPANVLIKPVCASLGASFSLRHSIFILYPWELGYFDCKNMLLPKAVVHRKLASPGKKSPIDV